MNRTCRTCGLTKRIDEFHNTGERGKGYRELHCKPCASAKMREWRQGHQEQLRAYERRPERAYMVRTPPEKRRAYARTWKARNPGYRTTPEAERAYYAVACAIKNGTLVRPDACSRCGEYSKIIDAAHHDYTKPLDIEWLCRRCHVLEDHANPKGGTHRIDTAARTPA